MRLGVLVVAAVAVFGFGEVDVVADEAEDIDLAVGEEVEGAATHAGGGLGKADDEDDAINLGREAEGVVGDEDGGAVEDDVVVRG